MPRLTSRIQISALIRRISGIGGNATVLSTGDESAGAILLICAEKGRSISMLERISNLAGDPQWSLCGPQVIENEQEISDYVARRRARDGDLWVVELDVPDAERFAALLIAET
jgi:hypothetical protein